MSLPLHESHAASYWQAYNISVPTSQKKVPYRKYEKGRSRLMCSYAQSGKSILFIVHTYKAWHSTCIILAVLLFWVACAADLVAINLYEQNKVCLSQFKFLVTSKGL